MRKHKRLVVVAVAAVTAELLVAAGFATGGRAERRSPTALAAAVHPAFGPASGSSVKRHGPATHAADLGTGTAVTSLAAVPWARRVALPGGLAAVLEAAQFGHTPAHADRRVGKAVAATHERARRAETSVRTTSQPAPAPASRSAEHTSTASSTDAAGSAAPAEPVGYGCGPALAYLEAHAAPGFRFECPGWADGRQAMTCINIAGLCAGEELIAIADPCPAAYMNEASNSWVLTGRSHAPIDPYGYCTS
jgi:hypothetical protein